VPSQNTGAEVLRPQPGSRAHWSHANPCGAYLTVKRITHDGNWQLEWGWPVAEPAKRQYDFNNHFTANGYGNGSASGYTGGYDADGGNE
jgi:hypothetical protein